MSNYGEGIDSSNPAWSYLNQIANCLGADYTLDSILLAANEVRRQRRTEPRDSYVGKGISFGSFGDLAQHRSMVVYVNKYAQQNIRELPYVWELNGCLRRQYYYKLGREPVKKYGLGAIWFYNDWLDSLRPHKERHSSKLLDAKVADDLYVDADPEWKKFIDSIGKLCSQEGLDLILFYWS